MFSKAKFALILYAVAQFLRYVRWRHPLFAARILALHDSDLAQKLAEHREAQADKVRRAKLPPA